MIETKLPEPRDGAVRIGVLADTHVHAGQIALPAAALEALRGVDLILHLGDMGEASVLDALGELAPVLATRGGDDPAEDPRIAPARLLVGPLQALAAAFELGSVVEGAQGQGGPAFPERRADELLRERARRAVHVVAFAATHQPALLVRDGVLFVNPGSATLPAKRGPSGLGTVARIVLRGRDASAEIVQL
ncbi:MAG: metallophosphoesterase family protein [Myxococcota bacterium]